MKFLILLTLLAQLQITEPGEYTNIPDGADIFSNNVAISNAVTNHMIYIRPPDRSESSTWLTGITVQDSVFNNAQLAVYSNSFHGYNITFMDMTGESITVRGSNHLYQDSIFRYLPEVFDTDIHIDTIQVISSMGSAGHSPAKNITFDGLTIEVSKSGILMQDNSGLWGNFENITIQNCVFIFIGRTNASSSPPGISAENVKELHLIDNTFVMPPGEIYRPIRVKGHTTGYETGSTIEGNPDFNIAIVDASGLDAGSEFEIDAPAPEPEPEPEPNPQSVVISEMLLWKHPFTINGEKYIKETWERIRKE